MPTPSSGSSISFSQIRNTFGSTIADINQQRYKDSPPGVLYDTSLGYWVRSRSGNVWALQVVWGESVVYSQTANQSSEPWWWNLKNIDVGGGIRYYRWVSSSVNNFAVKREEEKYIHDPSPYSLNDYYARRDGYVPLSGPSYNYGPAAFAFGSFSAIPTPMSAPSLFFGPGGPNKLSFSNFQGFTPRTGVGADLFNGYQQLVSLPPGRYFIGIRAIGGGGGGGGRDTRPAGNGGAGVFISGVVMIQTFTSTITIYANPGNGGSGGPNGRASWYANAAGGTVGSTSNQSFPVGGAGGKAGSTGTSGFGGGGGGATEVWVQYNNNEPILLCSAGGGGGGGGSGNADWPSGYDPNSRHGNYEVGELHTGGRLVYGGQGQNAVDSYYEYLNDDGTTSRQYIFDGGGSGGAGGGQRGGEAGTGGGGYNNYGRWIYAPNTPEGWWEQTGRGGRSGWAYRNISDFVWLEAKQTFSVSSVYPWSGSQTPDAWGAGGLAGQSNSASGSSGQRGNVEITYSNISSYDLPVLRSFQATNYLNYW